MNCKESKRTAGTTYLSDILLYYSYYSDCLGIDLAKLFVSICLWQGDFPAVKIHSPIMISGGSRQSCNILRALLLLTGDLKTLVKCSFTLSSVLCSQSSQLLINTPDICLSPQPFYDIQK